jgi:hypothetical protein
MRPKAAFLSSLIPFTVALSAAMAQGVPPSGGVTVPADSPLVPPGLGSGSELERYNDTYLGLHRSGATTSLAGFSNTLPTAH